MKLLTLFAFALFAFTQTASAQALDNRAISQRLDSLDENIQLIQRQLALGAGEPGSPNPGAARLAVQLGEIETEMRTIRGQIEDTNHKITQVSERMDRLQKDTDFRLRELEQKRTAIAPSPATPINPVENNAPISTNDGAWQGAEETDEAAGETDETDRKPVNASVDETTATPEFASARDHYNHAFRLMNQAKYQEAGDSFTRFVETYPKDALAGNAYYWLGESYYVRKDFLKAADYFRQGFEANPAGPKASDNLLKLATSLATLEKKTEACVVLKQVIAKFGSSSSTAKKKAEGEIARLSCTD